jgi:hypothetical protein
MLGVKPCDLVAPNNTKNDQKVFSTTLVNVRLDSVRVSNVELVQTTSIDPSSWNKSNEDYIPLELYNGIRSGNMMEPTWAPSSCAIESFEIPAMYRGMAIGAYATTKALVPRLECEEAKLSWSHDMSYPSAGSSVGTSVPYLNLTFVSASCHGQVERTMVARDARRGNFADWQAEMYYGTVNEVTCGGRPKFLVAVTEFRSRNARYVPV